MFIKILMVWKLLELYTKNCKKKKKIKKSLDLKSKKREKMQQVLIYQILLKRLAG